MKKIAIGSIAIVCFLGASSSTAFADEDEDMDVASILAEETDETKADFGTPMIGFGWDSKSDRSIFVFGYADWLARWFFWNAKGGISLFPVHDSFPNLTVGAGIGMGARPKFSFGLFLNLGMEFQGLTPSNLILHTGIEIALFLKLFGVDDRHLKKLGLVLSIGPSWQPTRKEDPEKPDWVVLVNVVFPSPF